MYDDNRSQEIKGEAAISPGVMIAAGFLLLLSLGGLLYFFLTPVR